MYNAEGLTYEQQSQVIEFLMYRVNPEIRAELMGSLPVAYAKMFPTVDVATIMEKVRIKLLKLN